MERRLIDPVALKEAFEEDGHLSGYEDNPGWDVFDDLSSSYYGKQMYFTQPDGTIYSRLSCGYMTFEEALSEFREAINMDGGAEG